MSSSETQNVETSTPANSRQLYRRLLAYVKPHWKIFTASIIAMILLGTSDALFAALLKPLLDGSFVDKDPDSIRMMPLLVIGIFILRGITSFISTVSLNWIATRLVMDLRNEMFEQILALPNHYFDKSSTGYIISRITYNANQVSHACTSALISLIKDSVTIIALLAWMFYLDWKLSMIFFILVPVAGGIIYVVSLRLRKLSRSLQNTMGDLTHVIEETIGGNRVIKIFGAQAFERKRFNAVNNWVRRFTMKFTTTSAFNAPIIELIAACALAFIIYVASLAAADGNMTVGGFVSFFAAMALLFGPTKRLTKVNENLQIALAASESIFDMLDEPGERTSGIKLDKPLTGAVQFDQVHYRYLDSEHPALSNINLNIKPGESIALVGESGSGKTTLVNMIPSFYVPDEGRILVDDIAINDIALDSLRDNISLVSQDVVLFDDTVANNIAYGNMASKYSKSDIIAAAEAAHAMEFISKMPQGLDTYIGENGLMLSGGQRQRLAIARAILKDTPLLILDEATSALDTLSEKHVQEAINTLQQGRTTIIIAHRLSTVKNVDRIIVMDKGCIAEMGTHDELMQKNGIYTRLQQMQLT
jgi:subfamily B ATP-binding cassette protein MsbA